MLHSCQSHQKYQEQVLCSMTDFYQSDPNLVLYYQDQITVSTILTWIRPAICWPPAIHQPVRRPGCRHNCSDLSFSWPRVRSSVFQLGWPCCQLRQFFGSSLVIRQKTKSIKSIHISKYSSVFSKSHSPTAILHFTVVNVLSPVLHPI